MVNIIFVFVTCNVFLHNKSKTYHLYYDRTKTEQISYIFGPVDRVTNSYGVPQSLILNLQDHRHEDYQQKQINNAIFQNSPD